MSQRVVSWVLSMGPVVKKTTTREHIWVLINIFAFWAKWNGNCARLDLRIFSDQWPLCYSHTRMEVSTIVLLILSPHCMLGMWGSHSLFTSWSTDQEEVPMTNVHCTWVWFTLCDPGFKVWSWCWNGMQLWGFREFCECFLKAGGMCIIFGQRNNSGSYSPKMSLVVTLLNKHLLSRVSASWMVSWGSTKDCKRIKAEKFITHRSWRKYMASLGGPHSEVKAGCSRETWQELGHMPLLGSQWGALGFLI